MGKTKIQVVGQVSTPKPNKQSLPLRGRAKKESLKEQKGVHIAGLKGGERVVMVSAEPVEPEKDIDIDKGGKKEIRRERRVHVHGKKYLAARAKVDPTKVYSVLEASHLVRETSISSFPGSVELHLVLHKNGLNTQATLPHSTGQTKKIEVATDSTIEKLKTGKIDFDVLLATPAMMPKFVPFAKLLGPRGLMPNPKAGTITDEPEAAKEKFGGNNLLLKAQKDAPLIHTVIAKITQPEEEISENLKAVLDAVGSKNIKKAVVSASMGPGIKTAVT